MSKIKKNERTKSGIKPIILAAFCLLLIAIGVIGWGYSKQLEYYTNADRSISEFARNTYAPIANSCLELVHEHQFDCLSKAINEYRQYRREEQDLAAQRTSANWAYLMGAAAIIGMLLSAFGVLLVFNTFQETREANIIARQANIDAKSAFIAERRPWICFESFEWNTMNGFYVDGHRYQRGYELSIIWKNVGMSPAIKTLQMQQYQVQEFDRPAPNFPKFKDPVYHSDPSDTLAPQRTITSRGAILIDNEIDHFESRKVAFYVYSKVLYEDSIGTTKGTSEMCLRFECNGFTLGKDGVSYPNIAAEPVAGRTITT